ncbi:Transcription factor [Phytophthora cinnamomi]|uniref:Transcription factor n=1 Tax=Phytophthora cinnamomi TaxID=4785 RepID=UPI0035594EF1|nr:Transcription factor [Phytophthora cinnamomi]
MATQDMMSPLRRRAQELPPRTPGAVRVAGAASIQPSPNRTEAAAAMMHLLAGSTSSGNSEEPKTCPALKPAKAKRRYVRKAPKKVGTSAKRQIKTAWMDSDSAAATGKPPAKADAETPEDGDKDAKNGDWRMDGDEVRFFPFREYNRKDKSLGLLCENFLKLYRDDKISEICLDRAATELGVERRRIYDIVNILESIHLVSRKSKNLYNWHGLASLPTSISAMKQRYAEMHKSSGGSKNAEYPSIKSDRRRGKSLSKLSQMFVQLFLGKEDCIIPLDQAAKQLIQMEDSENEEDRLLKTKIRRLYDVANVLVSVGLIEKLQLSNSRKPVFRWKTRNSTSTSTTSSNASSSMIQEAERDNKTDQPTSVGPVRVKSETMSPDADMEDADVTQSPQSCDSDAFDDGSDSPSDASSCGSKRKQSDQEGSDVSMSGEESSTKRSRLSERRSKRSPRATEEKSMGLLQMDANNEPIHPQTILLEQQEQLKLYMQQYIREYVNYLAAHQQLADDAKTTQGLTTPSKPNGSRDTHGTPVSLPSLAGSIQDLLLSESPQSVADIVAARVLSNPRPPLATSPIAAEPEAEATPRPLILSKKHFSSVIKTPPPTKTNTAGAASKDDEEQYDAPRNLIMALQPRSQS